MGMFGCAAFQYPLWIEYFNFTTIPIPVDLGGYDPPTPGCKPGVFPIRTTGPSQMTTTAGSRPKQPHPLIHSSSVLLLLSLPVVHSLWMVYKVCTEPAHNLDR